MFFSFLEYKQISVSSSIKVQINPYPASHDFCCLLILLLMFFGGLYCKQYGLYLEQSDQGSNCLLLKNLVSSAADAKSRQHFQDKNSSGIRF